MEYKEFKPAGQKNIKKIILIALGSLLAIAFIGFVTVTILHQLKAPTLTNTTQTKNDDANTTPPTPEKALATADEAAEKAAEKASSGDQKAALIDYRVAYENYKTANNDARAADMEFNIKAIEAVLAMPQTPARPAGGKATADK